MQIHTSAQEAKKKKKHKQVNISSVAGGNFSTLLILLMNTKNPLIFIHSVLSMVLVVSSDQC